MTDPRFTGALASVRARVEEQRAKLLRRTFPATEYVDKPVEFSTDILGFTPWDLQAEWMSALIPENSKVSVASGHKIGKTGGAASCALWYWGTRRRARIVLMAPKIEHIETVLWPEIRRLYLSAGRCAPCLAAIADDPMKARPPCKSCQPLGDPDWIGLDPTKGLRSPDGREIFAYGARDADALGGLSGENLFFIFDEASGIKQDVFTAMKGNEAGGARVLMIGNPLRTAGEFYDSRHSKRGYYSHVVTISSRDTPNARSGEKIIPGLATLEWCEARKEEWGETGAYYLIRVLGLDPKAEAGQIVPFDVLEAAEERWERTVGVGRLELGVDVAFTGDDAAVAVRRGAKIYEVPSFNGLDEYELAAHVIGIARAHLKERDQKPIVRYDSNGPGARFHKAIKAYEDEIEIVPVNGTRRPTRPKEFHQLRDEIAIHFSQWLRYGAIPKDGKLEGEILAVKKYDAGGGRARVTSNDELKKKENLGRSPDRRNACELAVFESTPLLAAEFSEEASPGKATEYVAGAISPYGGAISPYG